MKEDHRIHTEEQFDKIPEMDLIVINRKQRQSKNKIHYRKCRSFVSGFKSRWDVEVIKNKYYHYTKDEENILRENHGQKIMWCSICKNIYN